MLAAAATAAKVAAVVSGVVGVGVVCPLAVIGDPEVKYLIVAKFLNID